MEHFVIIVKRLGDAHGSPWLCCLGAAFFFFFPLGKIISPHHFDLPKIVQKRVFASFYSLDSFCACHWSFTLGRWFILEESPFFHFIIYFSSFPLCSSLVRVLVHYVYLCISFFRHYFIKAVFFFPFFYSFRKQRMYRSSAKKGVTRYYRYWRDGGKQPVAAQSNCCSCYQ